MPGKGHIPELTERIIRTLKANTNRTVGGFGSNASPGMTRDRVAASRRGSSGLPPTARSSKIDQFSVTDTATSSFVLTFRPITHSWNVELNGAGLLDTVEYGIVGKTLTIVTPADTFKGAATQGSPWDLQVQYDYLTAVPAGPSNQAGLTGNVATANITSQPDPLVATFPAAPAAGGAVLVAIQQSFASSTVTGLGATWTRLVNYAPGGDPQASIWIGEGCDGVSTGVTVSVPSSSPREVGCIEVTDVTSVGALTASGTSTAVGPLVAPAGGGIAIACIGQPSTLVSELPSAWTVVFTGNDAGAILLAGGQSASRTFDTSKAWVMALVASV